MPYSRTTWVSSETALSAANMNNIEDGIGEAMTAANSAKSVTDNIIDLIYPVGSIYISTVSTSPATLFGKGTWTRIQGRFLIGASSTYEAGDTGGAASQSYTPAGTTASVKLSAAQSGLPSHSHSATGITVTGGSKTNGVTGGGVDDGIIGGIHVHPIMTNSNEGTTSTYPLLVGGASDKGKWLETKIDREGHVHDLPDHTHNLASHTHTVGGSTASVSAAAASSGHSHTFTGTAATIDTLPPYLSVYMWKRTA